MKATPSSRVRRIILRERQRKKKVKPHHLARHVALEFMVVSITTRLGFPTSQIADFATSLSTPPPPSTPFIVIIIIRQATSACFFRLRAPSASEEEHNGGTHTRDSVGGGGVVLASFVVERFPTPSPADLFPRQISHLIALQGLVEGREGGGHLVSVVIVSLITIFCTHT